MPIRVFSRAPCLALFTGCASLLIFVTAANAQAWSDYPPPPAYPASPDAAYGSLPGPYSQSPYAPGGYAPYAGSPYAQNPYASPYGPYAAPRRAWRREAEQDQAAAAPPSSPPGAGGTPTPSRVDNAAPPSAAPKTVALAHRIVESASAYLAYMKKASAISPAFTDGADVAREVATGSAYDAKQFEEGAIAYAAIMALQEPAFIDGVRAAGAGEPARAEQIAGQLIANPAAAATFQGADAAAARASAALRRQGDRLMTAGVKVKQSAYDVQHSAWSKGDVSNPEARLAAAKVLSTTRLSPERAEVEKLLKLVLSEEDPSGIYGGASSPVVSRGLALAALAVLGQAGEVSAEQAAPLLTEERGGECLKMAKLNLFQCLAVAGPHYEDIFCLGQHAMMDTAQCVIKASGVSQPRMRAEAAPLAAPVPQQMAQATPAPQDYWVPLGHGASSEAAQK